MVSEDRGLSPFGEDAVFRLRTKALTIKLFQTAFSSGTVDLLFSAIQKVWQFLVSIQKASL
jgi:hypothetical protein